ncbi:MAG: NYN domain-containing protein [Cytophagaceae bacterium]|jgi:uncharacterized LabA/DUF88 family protein/cold shock CspA family protein|nr:NYN domain-containing protein [Cytophagaceae bacterium]
MANNNDLSLTKIGVFYDGNYFLHVSNYYNYTHERKSRLSVAGLHHFIRNHVAKQEGADVRLCQIVDAHYFRGRLSAHDASAQGNTLYYDRAFDDILSSEGVTTHYLPIKTTKSGAWQEKGIDVWLALEAFELAFYKHFDVIVLIASDGDYVPLIRKLNTLGARVMVLSWDFEYMNDTGKQMTTRTSQDLLEEVTYPLAMHEIIDNRVQKNDPLINGLFVPKNTTKFFTKKHVDPNEQQQSVKSAILINTENGKKISTIKALKDGYGFIVNQPKDAFFFHSSLMEYDFNDLEVGDSVEFKEETLDDGKIVAKDIKVIE